MAPASKIEIVEVAPRDGFQSIHEPIGTHEKIEIVEGLIQTGLKRFELGSFVSPRAVPQMADMTEIAAHFKNETRARMSVLVPNVKGAEIAIKNGLKEIVYVFSASEAHNQSNVRAPISQSLQGLKDVCDVASGDDIEIRVDLATAFDCPFDGTVPLADVMGAVDQIAAIAPKAEIALCDTTGRANPFEVSERFEAAMSLESTAQNTWAFHGHDTFGMGVANALAACRTGVGVIDTSAGGLGGCPFAPGATGNTATEDLVFAVKGTQYDVAIDLEALVTVADRIATIPEAMMGGHLRTVPRHRIT